MPGVEVLAWLRDFYPLQHTEDGNRKTPVSSIILRISKAFLAGNAIQSQPMGSQELRQRHDDLLGGHPLLIEI